MSMDHDNMWKLSKGKVNTSDETLVSRDVFTVDEMQEIKTFGASALNEYIESLKSLRTFVALRERVHASQAWNYAGLDDGVLMDLEWVQTTFARLLRTVRRQGKFGQAPLSLKDQLWEQVAAAFDSCPGIVSAVSLEHDIGQPEPLTQLEIGAGEEEPLRIPPYKSRLPRVLKDTMDACTAARPDVIRGLEVIGARMQDAPCGSVTRLLHLGSLTLNQAEPLFVQSLAEAMQLVLSWRERAVRTTELLSSLRVDNDCDDILAFGRRNIG
ncbi:hypothetical protein BC940DRAFT_329714 [Gongronella butleri]|nr:hypothetical protein BC940DRAFT_329714 [Gongronella butleri]